MLGLAHQGEVQCTVRDGICKISNSEFDLQIEAATGRPVELQMMSDAFNYSLTIRAQEHALNAELARLEEPLASSDASYDSASPWKARLDFALDELLFAAEQSQLQDGIESLHALHKLVHLWSPPALADLFGAGVQAIPGNRRCLSSSDAARGLVDRHDLETRLPVAKIDDRPIDSTGVSAARPPDRRFVGGRA